MDIDVLMPKDNKESDDEQLDSIKFNNNQYDVHGQKNEDGLTYQTIIIEKILNNEDGACDIVLNLNECNGQILQDNNLQKNNMIVANFKFNIDDNCNFEFKDITKLKKRMEFEFNDKDVCVYIEQTISKYCLNHSSYLTRIIDEDNETDDNIYSLNERKNPPFDDHVATLFEKELQEKYQGSFIKFMEQYIPNLIIDEINNVIKLTLGAITVILGLHSFFFEILGDAGIGKTALMEIVIDHCIPDGYVIILNSTTEPAFLRHGENNPRHYERLILYFGDLGDEDRFKQLNLIFDIVKILITDKIYRHDKSGQNKQSQWDKNIEIVLKSDSIGCLYGSVQGNQDNSQSDIKGQKQSRILPITPSTHGNIELATFDDQSETYGTKGFDDYKIASDKMLEWQEYLKKKIANFNKDKYVFVNPFRHMFNNSFKFSSVWIRDYKRNKSLLKTLSYINLERSIKIEKDGRIFVIPCLEDVKDFLKVTSDNMGLRVNEKNLLLKLKNEFAFDFDKIADNVIMANEYNPKAKSNQDNSIDEHYQNIVDGCIIHAKRHGNHDVDDATLDDWQGKNDKSVLLSPEIVDKLYSLYGLTDKNRRKNKNDEDALPILFFTASQVKRIFKGHNAIKSVSNVNETLNSFVEKGFLQKLPYKSASRNENVFYVEPLILDVHEQYEITSTDRIEAIAVIMNDMYVFDEKDIKKICKDYKVRFSDVEKYIEDHSEI